MAISSNSMLIDQALGRRLILVASWALLYVVAFSGCNRGPAMYQVRGHVTYPDGSIPSGGVAVVSFLPAEDTTAEIRKGATGAIGADGSFELFTRVPGDGAYAGQYIVTFVVQKGVMDNTPLIADKYRIPSLSPYTVTVDRNIYDLKFEIEPLPGAPRAAGGGGGGGQMAGR